MVITWSFVSKLLHNLVTIALVVVSLTFMGLCYSTKSANMPLLLTQTFYTTYFNNLPTLTWSQPSTPKDTQYVTQTLFTCLRVSGVGTDSYVDCGGLDDAKYKACLLNTTSSVKYIAKRFNDALAAAGKTLAKNAAEIKKVNDTINGFFPAGTSPINFLPSPGQSSSNFAQLGTIETYLAGLRTPYANQISAIYNKYLNWRGMQSCVLTAENFGQFPSAMPLDPVFDRLWQCASEVVPVTRAQAFAFKDCVPLSAWPAQDELQTVYSPIFLGSYNRFFLALLGTWIITSFAVYTFWFGESKSSTIGRPADYLGRTGVVLAGVCALWNAGGGLITVTASAFSSGESMNGFPMTVQTVLVAGAVAIAGTAYFLTDFWEQLFHQEGDAVWWNNPLRQRGSTQFNYRGRTLVPLSGYARIGKTDTVVSDEQTAPWVVFPWSDAWLLTDGLLLLAVMGSSVDVVTADVGRIFLAATYAAAGHSAFVRLVYEAYFNKEDRDPTPGGLRVMVFLVQMAIMWFLVGYLYLLLHRYGSTLITTFPFFTSVAPMVLWFLYSLSVETSATASPARPPMSITSMAQTVFIWNASVRFVYICVILAAATEHADPNARLRNYVSLISQ